MTSTIGSDISVSRQASRTYALRQLLGGTEAPNVGFVWIERARQRVEQAKCAKDTKEVLNRHAAVTTLQARDRSPSDS
jgi:hypothetical protein